MQEFDLETLKDVIIPAISAIVASILTFLAKEFSSKRSSKNKMDSLYMENITKILNQYKEDIKELKIELEEYSNENYKLRETVVELQKENLKLQKLNSEVINKNNELLASNEELKNSNIKMQRLIEELNTKISNN